ncbi:anti-sigma factor family protein [Parafilimonas sp.]|uniref:anti-sigma factor family protein n=1 Tax=Parafilimonas sp. TaxID=1969739 RepID=UPI0039E3518F
MQTINRNNYEEFFLLYIDGELNAVQQLAVENFVQQNPDLAVDLQMLQNTRLFPEDIVFDNKEGLLRTEGHTINETNYEEFFLLYIDNELSPAKREEVEKYVLQHPKLQEEFITLKQAMLVPEVISYGNKEALYRTEKRKTFYLKPLYWAAAAIFTGLCGVGVWMIQPANNVKPPVAINNPDQTKQPTQNALADKAVTTDSIKKEAKQEPVIAEKTLPGKSKQKTIVKATSVKKKKDDSVTPNPEDNIIQNKQDKVAYEPPVIKRSSNNNITRQLKEPPAEKHDVAASLPQTINHQQDDAASLQTPVKEDENNGLQNGYRTYNVAYKEINTNDEDRSLRIGMLDLNKDKVKGFFKKAGRMFGRPNNNENEDGKLQVANFEINTKKQ